MIDVKFLTIAEMNSAIASQQADLAAMETILSEKLSVGLATAQAKRLVATYVAGKQAWHLLQQAIETANTLNTLTETPADGSAAPSCEANLLAKEKLTEADIIEAATAELG